MSVPADPKATVTMRDFPGLILDQDPRDIQAGAGQVQRNLVCFNGEMNVRKGIRQVMFEAIIDAT